MNCCKHSTSTFFSQNYQNDIKFQKIAKYIVFVVEKAKPSFCVRKNMFHTTRDNFNKPKASETEMQPVHMDENAQFKRVCVKKQPLM